MTGLGQQYVEACQRGNVALRCRLELELLARVDDPSDRLRAPEALMKAALWYASQGIAVFPCAPRGKKPIVSGGFTDASTNQMQIVQWWAATPNANIGAPTGHSFDVIDLDGAEGVSSMYFDDDAPTLPVEIGHSLTTDFPGHHIFIKPTGRGNKVARQLKPGVDFRGIGGYVILPPSIGANGRRYEWTKPIDVLS